MPVVACPSCRSPLSLSDGAAGQFRCPKCQKPLALKPVAKMPPLPPEIPVIPSVATATAAPFRFDDGDGEIIRQPRPRSKLPIIVGGCVLLVVLIGTAIFLAARSGSASDDTSDGSVARIYAFGERIKRGDLKITIRGVTSGWISGQHHGQFDSIQLMYAVVSVENTSGGKISVWHGWQGSGVIQDEHGNRFHPVTLKGWTWLPKNDWDDMMDGDFAVRVNPKTTATNAVYYQFAPPTSTKVTISLPLDGKTIHFSGKINDIVP